ncbi:MAG: DUF4434 domain-containing protein [Clostridia bacterium]|nr:DUF4434 domain-containing protein [Clostridia bacterium]
MFSLIKNFFVALMAVITFSVPFGDVQMPERKCAPEFSGTFLQSWMSSSWDEERWKAEVECMQRDGVEYLVLQDVANMDAEGNWTVYYNSTIPAFDGAAFGGDVVGAALNACKGTDIRIFIGLAMFDSFWLVGNFTGEYKSVCETTADMLEDIYDNYYSVSPENFYGWYFTPEINNQINCGPLMGKMVNGFNIVLDRATEVDSSLPMMISPYTAHYLDLGDVATYSQWLTFFECTAFRDGDIVAPQDAVGADWVEEDDLVSIWEMYSAASEKADADIKLWANCENFDIATGPSFLGGTILRPQTENIESVTATLDRFVMQMDVASRYCENIITFSYSHYYSPNLVKSMYIETYRDYVENGYVLETEKPTAPANATAVSDENGVTVSWEASEDNFGIAYYRVCRNGEFLTRVENYKWDYPLTVTDINGVSGDTYTITAVDAAGNQSVAEVTLG